MSSGTTSTYWRVGALYGAAGVCLGAFGAHGLKSRISDPAKIASWGTAAQYQVRPHLTGSGESSVRDILTPTNLNRSSTLSPCSLPATTPSLQGFSLPE